VQAYLDHAATKERYGRSVVVLPDPVSAVTPPSAG
jgi:hypothetical protein